MRRVATWVCITLLQCGVAACPEAATPRENPSLYEAANRDVLLCSDSGTFDVNVALGLRNELGQRGMKVDRQLEIRQALDTALMQCGSNLSAPNAELVGTLYVLLGNQFLSAMENLPAKNTFEMANRFYSSRALPSLMWLEALQGTTRAEVRLHDLKSADETAAKQAKLARSWVSGQGFPRAVLADALRFQAEVLSAENRSDEAKEIQREADQLE
jgi:hypothetical protein